MTCTSCAARVQKKLNRLDGVEARSTTRPRRPACATTRPRSGRPSWSPRCEQTGYTARLPQPPASRRPTTAIPARRTAAHAELADLKQRLLISAALTLPVLVLAMVPAAQFDNWQWLSLTLAAPVVMWGGWPFHRAAALQPAAPRRDHGHAGVAGHAGSLRVVALRPVLRRRRHARHADALRPDRLRRRRVRADLSRSRVRGRGVPARSAAISRRGPSAAPVRP